MDYVSTLSGGAMEVEVERKKLTYTIRPMKTYPNQKPTGPPVASAEPDPTKRPVPIAPFRKVSVTLH